MGAFESTIKNYLDKRAEKDSLFAVSYKKENKSIQECCKYIYSQAKKLLAKGVKCCMKMVNTKIIETTWQTG